MLLSKTGRLYPALSATTITLLLGLALAVAVGTGVGLFIGVSPRLSRAIGPLLEFLKGYSATGDRPRGDPFHGL